MKSLIIGARGLVGSALSRKLPDAILGNPVEANQPNERYTDVTKYETLFKVFSKERPDMVYLSAGISSMDACGDPLGTDWTNIRGAITVLRLCESFGAKLVYFSSPYVFDGKKKEPYTLQDETNPINNYGKQKETVERMILQSDAKYVIVRTVGVYGRERLSKNFAKQVISAIFKGVKVFAATDQFLNPILSDDLAKIVVQLAGKYQGLFHVAGDTCLSKYDFAVRIASQFQLENLIVPRTTEEMNHKVSRIANGCLDCAGLKELGLSVPSFDDGLSRFVSMPWSNLPERFVHEL